MTRARLGLIFRHWHWRDQFSTGTTDTGATVALAACQAECQCVWPLSPSLPPRARTYRECGGGTTYRAWGNSDTLGPFRLRARRRALPSLPLSLAELRPDLCELLVLAPQQRLHLDVRLRLIHVRFVLLGQREEVRLRAAAAGRREC